MTEAHQTDTVSAERSYSRETIAVFFLVIVIAVIGAYYLSAYLVPKPKIGIIDVQAPIGISFAQAIATEVDFAIRNDDIKAVVLVINSPGGSAAAGNDIYLQMRKLRDKKPVVATTDILAASAAYQIGMAANEFYAKPSSFVGSIGVIMGRPGPETLSEQFVTSGPHKAIGASTTGVAQMQNLLYADFRDSVVAERSAAPNPLKLSPNEVATGELWIGIQAMELGLIDAIGSNLDAIERAAELAGVTDYEVVNVRDAYLASLEGFQLEAAQKLYAEVDSQPDFDLNADQSNWPTFYQLYIPLE